MYQFEDSVWYILLHKAPSLLLMPSGLVSDAQNFCPEGMLLVAASQLKFERLLIASQPKGCDISSNKAPTSGHGTSIAGQYFFIQVAV